MAVPGSSSGTFQDRRHAGSVLGEMLADYRIEPGALVLGLARGGVPVGAEVAAALAAELDVFVVRKLGVPQWPELAMGAVASGGGVVVNDHVLSGAGVSRERLAAVLAAETAEVSRREAIYRASTPSPTLVDRTVILVDDGIATGATMLAAVLAVRAGRPRRIVVAVPVGPRSVYGRVGRDADDVLIATVPRQFVAVGQVYACFRQVTDAEVRTALMR